MTPMWKQCPVWNAVGQCRYTDFHDEDHDFPPAPVVAEDARPDGEACADCEYGLKCSYHRTHGPGACVPVAQVEALRIAARSVLVQAAVSGTNRELRRRLDILAAAVAALREGGQ